MKSFTEIGSDDPHIIEKILREEYSGCFTQRQFDFLWSEAYDRAHSGGLEEVFYEFISLADIYLKVKLLEI